MRGLRWLAGVLAGLLVLIGLGTIVPRPSFSAGQAAEVSERQILVLSNPIHTDIALPLDEEVRSAFADLAPSGLPIDAADAAYLVIGWGGRSFYLETPEWSDLKPLPVLRSLTVDRSVMHVDVARSVALDHPSVRVLAVSDAGRQRLIDAIRASFARDAGFPRVIEGAGYGISDRFYEANGWFNALIGCNTWTAATLREAGVVTGAWTPLPQLLSLSLSLHNSVAAQSAKPLE